MSTKASARAARLAFNELKIKQLEVQGISHEYNYQDFKPWTGNNYIKAPYDVLFPDGRILKGAWPNAGLLDARWGPADNVKVRLSQESED